MPDNYERLHCCYLILAQVKCPFPVADSCHLDVVAVCAGCSDVGRFQFGVDDADVAEGGICLEADGNFWKVVPGIDNSLKVSDNFGFLRFDADFYAVNTI